MEDTSKNTNILECCSVKGRLEKLQEIFELLERCQKSLSDYLDVKRNAFPRFFYISDDELLSILGTSDPTSVQEHMLKLYDNCAELKFGRGNKTVVGMVSAEENLMTSSLPARLRAPWRSGWSAWRRRCFASPNRQGGRVLLREKTQGPVDKG